MNLVSAGLFERLTRLFRPAKRVPRLSSESALALARSRAASEGYDPEKLQMVTHREVDGRLQWHVSEAAVGGVLLVEIDDENGGVNFIGRLPGR
jgi:hypothetical protein